MSRRLSVTRRRPLQEITFSSKRRTKASFHLPSIGTRFWVEGGTATSPYTSDYHRYPVLIDKKGIGTVLTGNARANAKSIRSESMASKGAPRDLIRMGIFLLVLVTFTSTSRDIRTNLK